MSYRKIGNEPSLLLNIKEETPGWLSNQSRFVSVPSKYVLIALENQFQIKFIGKEFIDNQKFTGSFPHDDLELALKVVLASLQIEYSISRDNSVILKD